MAMGCLQYPHFIYFKKILFIFNIKGFSGETFGYYNRA